MIDAVPSKRSLLRRSLLIAASFLIMKLAAGLAGHSIALLASAADSFMDFLISLANYVFVRTAEKPADKNHPYGHGKIESLAGFAQSFVIGGVALALLAGAIYRFINPETPVHSSWGVAIMLLTIGVNIWHVRNLRKSASQTESTVMATEFVHFASDSLANAGVIAALLLARWTGQSFWDPLMSLIIVFYLLKSVGGIFRESLSELLDERLADEVIHEIKNLIDTHDSRIQSYHGLRTRKVGTQKFIEFHVVLKGVESFQEAHRITEDLTRKLEGKFPGAAVGVYPHPENC